MTPLFAAAWLASAFSPSDALVLDGELLADASHMLLVEGMAAAPPPLVVHSGTSGVTPMGKGVGIGIQVGVPTALTLKYMLASDQGLVVGIGAGGGWAFFPGFSLHLDYLWHPSTLAVAPPFRLTWYVGGGAWMLAYTPGTRSVIPGYAYVPFPSWVWLGVRVPLGLSLALTELPIEFYLEATPAILIFPAITFGLGATLGVRFYF